jgi:hypothetical protein
MKPSHSTPTTAATTGPKLPGCKSLRKRRFSGARVKGGGKQETITSVPGTFGCLAPQMSELNRSLFLEAGFWTVSRGGAGFAEEEWYRHGNDQRPL